MTIDEYEEDGKRYARAKVVHDAAQQCRNVASHLRCHTRVEIGCAGVRVGKEEQLRDIGPRGTELRHKIAELFDEYAKLYDVDFREI